MLIIGRNPIIETLKVDPGSLKKIIILEGTDDKKISEIVKTARRNGVLVVRQSKQEFRKIFNEKNKSDGISQGVAAIAEEFQYSNFEEVIAKLSNKKESVLVVLDEVQDPHNLGSIIRTSVAANVDAVIVSEKNSTKITHTVIKSSSGAVNYVPVIQVRNIYNILKILKEAGFLIIGTALKGNNKELHNYLFPARCAVIFGNEGFGLRKNIMSLCDVLIKIPVANEVQSLNVSVSSGVVLYEIKRQREQV